MQAPSFGPPVNGLRLGLQWRSNFTLAFVLENVGPAPLLVHSHVSAGREHLDWYELTLSSATNAAPPRVLRFSEDRERSALLTATIAPNAQLAHVVDTREWGRSPSNRPAAGWRASPNYLLALAYDTSREHGAVWRGRLASGQLSTWVDLG